jgi:hypothetical protein
MRRSASSFVTNAGRSRRAEDINVEIRPAAVKHFYRRLRPSRVAIIDIDGRGNTVKEAVQDMWERMIPLEDEGYHSISSVEVVDTKTKQVVENFQITDPEWAYLKPSGEKKKFKTGEHRPPTAHEFKFKARIKLES